MELTPVELRLHTTHTCTSCGTNAYCMIQVGNVVMGNHQAELVIGDDAQGGRVSANVGAPDAAV